MRGRPSVPRNRSSGTVGAGHEAGTVERSREGSFMLDVIILAIALGLFVLTVGYAYGCERL